MVPITSSQTTHLASSNAPLIMKFKHKMLPGSSTSPLTMGTVVWCFLSPCSGSPCCPPIQGFQDPSSVPEAHKGTHLLSCDFQALFPLLLLCIDIQSCHDINSHQLRMETATNSLCRPGFLLTPTQTPGHSCLFFLRHTVSSPPGHEITEPV